MGKRHHGHGMHRIFPFLSLHTPGYLLFQLPVFTFQHDKVSLLELLLRRSDSMLPFFAKALAVDDSINCIVAQVGVNCLDFRMQFISG